MVALDPVRLVAAEASDVALEVAGGQRRRLHHVLGVLDVDRTAAVVWKKRISVDLLRRSFEGGECCLHCLMASARSVTKVLNVSCSSNARIFDCSSA